MNAIHILACLVLLCLAAAADAASAVAAKEQPAFPLKVSPNGRYLMDQKGQPFFLHADTGWDVAQCLTLDQAKFYFNDRKAKGFNTIIMTVLADVRENVNNCFGQNPFTKEWDLTKPNERYWKHVDACLDLAKERGLLVLLSSMWLGAGTPIWRDSMTPEAATSFGQFLGQRYKRFDNIIWIGGGDRRPESQTYDAILNQAEELKKAAPHQLQTYHSAHEYASAAEFPQESWLDIDFAYTYAVSYKQVLAEYARTRPVRPVILGETGYEAEPNAIELLPDRRRGDAWSPYLIRRQMWWALTSGACGVANGSAVVWRFADGWPNHLDMAGTLQMAQVEKLITSRPWWRLVPDPKHKFLTAAFGTFGQADYATAALADDGSFALIYLPNARAITVDLAKLGGGKVAAWWYNPRDGRLYDDKAAVTRGPFVLPPENRELTPPSSGREDDWVLLLDDAARSFKAPGQ